MKRIVYVFLGCLTFVSLFWTVMKYQTFHFEVDEYSKHWLSVSRSDPLNNAKTKDYLPEEEALAFGPLTDIQNAASLSRSTIQILGHKTTFEVGEKILISIILKNKNGKRRTRGGDKLHARIYNSTHGAYASGHVIDHGNDSYTAELPTLWPGRSVISIYVAYPRELIRVIYATMREYFTSRQIYGRFMSGKANEEVLCMPAREYLPKSVDVCNLTLANGGMSWYCVKPKYKQLLCEDWTDVRNIKGGQNYINTAAESLLFGRLLYDNPEFKNISTMITGLMPRRHQLPACSSVPKTLTWIQKKPSGFFYQDRWHLNYCSLPFDDQYQVCLRGKHFLIFGDSTSRQWFEYMEGYLNCTQVTEQWTRKAWHKRALCVSVMMNFTAEWIPHAQPFYTSRDNWEPKQYTTHPIAAYLDEIPSNSKGLVIVVHMFTHLIAFPSKIFRDRINAIQKSARKLLDRNKDIKVLIKGPHTFKNLYSYNYYLYRSIIKEEFKDMFDRVVFMEQGDMAKAKCNMDSHPTIDIVQEAVRQLIGLSC